MFKMTHSLKPCEASILTSWHKPKMEIWQNKRKLVYFREIKVRYALAI